MRPHFSERVKIPDTDLEVTVSLENDQLTIALNKSDARVYRVVVEQATMPIEHRWLSDLFMQDHRVRLSEFTSDLEDYVQSLDLSQG
jgi:hypothetical protein